MPPERRVDWSAASRSLIVVRPADSSRVLRALRDSLPEDRAPSIRLVLDSADRVDLAAVGLDLADRVLVALVDHDREGLAQHR